MVDVDARGVAAALEARFPELTAATPREDTARGRHYFFARSGLADEHGYYDGARLRLEHGETMLAGGMESIANAASIPPPPPVDIKTRTASGGRGLVVTAPRRARALSLSLVF